MKKLPDRGYLDTNLHVPKHLFNVEGVKRALTFTYLEGKDRTPTDLPLYKETSTHLVVPREFWPHVKLGFDIVDCRPQSYKKSPVRSRIQLDHKRLDNGTLIPTGDHVQQEALNALLNARGGILQLACGKGKTVIFLEAIARLKVPALIVVDNTQLLEQWRRSIETFLEVPGGVGLIQAQTFDWKKWVVLATYQTLAARAAEMPEEVRRWFGVVGWDEAHHVNAPTFSRSADLFYGRRYGLTATPERDDGLHVIHQFHFGNTFYRDLKQELRPRIYFAWTGFELDLNDHKVIQATHSINGELHLSKLASYFGTWRARLDYIMNELRKALAEERKILVLSNSVDELVNLFSLWNGNTELYTDLNVSLEEIGEENAPFTPIYLEPDERRYVEQQVKTLEAQIPDATAKQKTDIDTLLLTLRRTLNQHELGKKLQKVLRKKQREYITKILNPNSDAGLMIYKVDPARRMKMLAEKRVIFSIMKYGKEGLDDKALDTVLLCELMGSKGMLQQVMGRILRFKERKKTPVMIALVDNIRPILGMSKKMQRHLKRWPIEDGGPYEYELLNYPKGKRA